MVLIVWVELYSALIKILIAVFNLIGICKIFSQKDKMFKVIACVMIVCFVICELINFFYYHQANSNVISNYESGYTYNQQNIDTTIRELVDEYNNHARWQSAITCIAFIVVIVVIAFILNNKRLIKNRFGLILSGVILLAYMSGIVIPMSFTSTKSCSFTSKPVYEINPITVYKIVDGKKIAVSVSIEFVVENEVQMDLFESTTFDANKMLLLSTEMISAVAAIYVLRKHSSYQCTNIDAVYKKENTNDDK